MKILKTFFFVRNNLWGYISLRNELIQGKGHLNASITWHTAMYHYYQGETARPLNCSSVLG